jgi:transposase
VYEEEQFGATMSQVRRLRAWLEERRVEAVMMESTATYWKPFYYGLAGAGFEVVLVNPYHVKALKGRKSDMSDAKWLSVQAALGVAPRSLVPGRDQVDLRLATRQRRKAVGRRTQLENSLEKLLEDAQTKLSSAGSKLLTKSGRAFLESIAEGRDDPEELAKLSRLRKTKGAELVEMLEGEWRPIHRALIRDLLNGFDAEDRRVLSLEARIAELAVPFAAEIGLLEGIDGIGPITAVEIVAETGGDMSVFETAEKLAAWAGVAPGSNQSGRKSKAAKCRKGNKYLKAALGDAARAAVNKNGSFYQARYRRVAARRGPANAYTAVARSIARAVWAVLSTRRAYQDLGGDFYDRKAGRSGRARKLAALRAKVADLEAMICELDAEQPPAAA